MTEKQWLAMMGVRIVSTTQPKTEHFAPVCAIEAGKRAYQFECAGEATKQALRASSDTQTDLGIHPERWENRDRRLLKHKALFVKRFQQALEYNTGRFLD